MTVPSRSFARSARLYVPALLWLTAAGLMWRDWQLHPYDPNWLETGTRPGNGPDSLVLGLGCSVAELVGYYLCTWPWLRKRPTWLPSLTIFGLLSFGLWTFLNMAALMHSGGIQGLHVLWLLTVDVLLVVELVLGRLAAK